MAFRRQTAFKYPPPVPVISGGEPLARGLVCWWRFEQADVAGSTLRDRSGKRYDTTMTGSPTMVPGKVGRAINLNGTSQYASSSAGQQMLQGATSCSVSAWINPTSVTNQTIVVRQVVFGADPFEYFGAFIGIFTGSGKVDWVLAKDSVGSRAFVSSAASVSTNTWTHFVGTWDGATMRIYLNGVLDANTAAFSGPVGGTNTTNNVDVGTLIGGGSTYNFSGSVDDIMIWKNRCLTGAEVRRLYADTTGGTILVKPMLGLPHTVVSQQLLRLVRWRTA